MKIAVIGAGCSGLSALRYGVAEGHDIVAFEQAAQIGGTWVYTKLVGLDENGIPIHSSMYEGLTTNIPKELMEYDGYHYPSNTKESYVDQNTVLRYMQDFVKHFKLEPFIKLNTQVIEVDPLPDEKWNVKTRNVITKLEIVQIYDAILICNGHFKQINMVHLKGIENFKGTQIHSHNYRTSEHYINKKVLLIGAGPSGTDIASLLALVAKKVILSYKRSTWMLTSKEVMEKPWVQEVFENSVRFEDGTMEEITDIIFCTGYVYDFPFLSSKCGIEVQNNFIRTLYKHIINIQHPTMAFLGILTNVRFFPVIDLQSKFVMSFFRGNFKVSKEDMLVDFRKELKKFEESGTPLRLFHVLCERQREYCEDLAEVGRIPKLPQYIYTLFDYILENYDKSKKFRIINENEFEILN